MTRVPALRKRKPKAASLEMLELKTVPTELRSTDDAMRFQPEDGCMVILGTDLGTGEPELTEAQWMSVGRFEDGTPAYKVRMRAVFDIAIDEDGNKHWLLKSSDMLTEFLVGQDSVIHMEAAVAYLKSRKVRRNPISGARMKTYDV